MIDYEWDPYKAHSNVQKHGISFAEAVTVFGDVWLLTREDEMHLDEQRYVAIGANDTGRVLVVVFTYRGSKIRIISVRKATPREQVQYERGQL